MWCVERQHRCHAVADVRYEVTTGLVHHLLDGLPRDLSVGVGEDQGGGDRYYCEGQCSQGAFEGFEEQCLVEVDGGSVVEGEGALGVDDVSAEATSGCAQGALSPGRAVVD
jgi:hypothetical protein